MVCTQKDKEGKVIAYAEYNIVDSQGNFTLNGDYAFVFDAWIHESCREGSSFIRKWLRQERNKHPYVTYIYWTRGKYKNKMSKYEIRRIIHGWKFTASTGGTRSTVSV